MTLRIKTVLTAFLLLTMSACTQEGINAGEDGGKAFIAMAGMLVLTVFLMWFFLGRDD
jgi:hypothetical protein